MQTSSNQWADNALKTIQSRGHRCGSARKAIIALLSRQSCCFSAKVVNDSLAASGQTTGLASIYRTLDLLKELGLITSLELGDGTIHYELCQADGEHHHHILCDGCNTVEIFHDDLLEKTIADITESSQFEAVSHEVTLRGLCPNCQKKAKI